MSYQPTTIADAVSCLNNQWFLPAIQREFVWKPEQIIELFDSILRGYPISSFLFWELKEENRDKWEAYKFIENASQGTSHNETANIEGVHNMIMVLDGQQRLTSLLVGLKGTYTTKQKYRRWDDPSAWIKKKLFIDLLKDPRSSEENDDINSEGNLYYRLAFVKKAPAPTLEKYWFPVGKILDFDSEDAFYEFRDKKVDELPDNITKKQISVFQRNLERSYRAVWKDEVIAYYKENDQDYDRVLDIFIRANEGGTKLSKSDLLLSMVTSKWHGINEREEIFNFVDYLNEGLTRHNNFDKDFIMKTCLVLTDLPVAYKVANFNSKNLQKIKNNWDDIKSAITQIVDLINYFGIDRYNLTSVNSIIPIIYYKFLNKEINLRGTSLVEKKSSSLIRKWLIISLLNGVFGGSSDNVLRDTRTEIKNSEINEFPIEQINNAINRTNRKFDLDEYSIGDILTFLYGRQLTFLALSLIYEENGWGVIQYQQDHIFPKKLFRKSKLKEIGIAETKMFAYIEKMNSIGNLQLLMANENQEKQDKPFHEWIQTRDSSFLKNHLIPKNNNLWRIEKFLEFINERERMLKEKYTELF